MKKITMTFKVLTVAAAFVILAGCNSLSKNAESSSLIVIESITGTTMTGDDVAYLESDVLGTGNVVQADVATANITIRLVNPDPINGPSQFNDVVLTSYRVTYDLPASPGNPPVDVPMPFDGNFSTVLCEVDNSTAVPFMVVSTTAKQSAPLTSLIGTTNVIESKAKIEIFGHDLTDKPVTATGYLTIYFADYQDVPSPRKK